MIITTLITILVLITYTSYSKLVNEVDSLNNQILELNQEIINLNNDTISLNKEIETYKKINKTLNLELKKLRDTPTRSHINRQFIGTFEATAYTDDVASQGKWVGQTASGMKPQAGVIAVDPNVIPLGTKLYVEGYGNCIAGDTGGAIKGNRIDLFMNSSQKCKAWGRKEVKVYRLDE